jgi:muramoyltetrapeptide carboxypeptidase
MKAGTIMDIIKPRKLNQGDTIGIIAPSYALTPELFGNFKKSIEDKGFTVKLSKNIFSSAYGYAGTIEERADDFNTMIADSEVKMLLFGGGEVCNEILPYINYEKIVSNPKIICSYSDSTTLLNAIYSKTGMVTFYGASLRTFENMTDYNWNSFTGRLMTESLKYRKGSKWKSLHHGNCSGRLIGGYLANFAIMQNGEYFKIDKTKPYILFLEDHEKFSSPAVITKYFSHLEQSGIFDSLVGLIFGHYSPVEHSAVNDILSRIGAKYNMPVIKNDDFGHGSNNSILPIGGSAKLATDTLSFSFLESSVV